MWVWSKLKFSYYYGLKEFASLILSDLFAAISVLVAFAHELKGSKEYTKVKSMHNITYPP